ncbi:hypothetical protein NP511_22630 (plasmid) [Natrinema thermotolerans]|uniref:Uncharacterized protein n=1 Tax=Natrinema thermotolerans TaxID=121872 RepID=A0AAF0PFM0_9EURY|nr:hypothetical protein [Natrinema thermotolerans]WMT10332.1 hypothetical protein NP511_22630 [Natrinema thermotolerans]
MTDSEVQVFIPTLGNKDRAYHTDENCRYVGSRHYPASLKDAKDRGLEECQLCADEFPTARPDFSVYEAAVEAGKEGGSPE